jgi:hypothetical protein
MLLANVDHTESNVANPMLNREDLWRINYGDIMIILPGVCKFFCSFWGMGGRKSGFGRVGALRRACQNLSNPDYIAGQIRQKDVVERNL